MVTGPTSVAPLLVVTMSCRFAPPTRVSEAQSELPLAVTKWFWLPPPAVPDWTRVCAGHPTVVVDVVMLEVAAVVVLVVLADGVDVVDVVDVVVTPSSGIASSSSGIGLSVLCRASSAAGRSELNSA